MTRILLIIAVLAAAILWFNRGKLASPELRKKLIVYGIIGGLVLLAVSGKMHWLFTALGAAAGFLWLFVQKSLFIFRAVPIAGPFLFRFFFRNLKNQAHFTSDWLKIFIHRPSGAIDGEILQGDYHGRHLSSLGRADLNKLLETLRAQDRKGFLLMQSYLLIRYRQAAQEPTGKEQQAPASSGMSREEALRILGLCENTNEEAIRTAHKQLMQKLHPDRGGSTYLAAKINEAKDFLLKNL